MVDCTGRIIREDKSGYLDSKAEKILQRLNINEVQWIAMSKNFEGCFGSFAGNEKSLRSACEKLKYQRPSGLGACKQMFH